VCVCGYVGGTAMYLFIYACKSCESDVVDDGGPRSDVVHAFCLGCEKMFTIVYLRA